MKRHAAHRRSFIKAAVLTGQGQFQLAACRLRVLEKHFIKIADAEEQQRIRVLLLDLHILLHHG